MPTYDYECQACGHRYEHFGKLHETGLRVCPRCNKKKAKRLIGAGAGFIFKGSGFYVTDSRGNGSAHSASESKKTDVKAESKPALKGGEASPSGPSESKTKKKSD